MRAFLALLLVAGLAAPGLAESGPPARERLFRDLADEVAAVREDARRSLEKSDDLGEAEVRSALASADTRAKIQILRLVAARKMKGLVPEACEMAAAEDPRLADAAVRALVSLGDEAVAAGRQALAARPERIASLTHLEALAAQCAVERGVLSRWRRKGGQYEGRYNDLAKLGWPVQPVLLAMLLDVPLADHYVVVPAAKDDAELAQVRREALNSIARSNRRGYTTFEPLPSKIETDDIFELASQALRDVGDMDLLGDILERTSEELENVDDSFGPRLRRWEQNYFQQIDQVLYARGRRHRLEATERKLRGQAGQIRHWLEDGMARMRAEDLEMFSYRLSPYAQVLHQMGRYEEASKYFTTLIQIGRRLGGKDPAIEGYNRACSLAKLGRTDAALAQLERALDRNVSNGSEDLTPEWVMEDGDLASLHDDPRFKELMQRRFGEVQIPTEQSGSPQPQTPPPAGKPLEPK